MSSNQWDVSQQHYEEEGGVLSLRPYSLRPLHRQFFVPASLKEK